MIALASRTVTTLAGVAAAAGSANGVGTLARFSTPFSTAVDAYGGFALVTDKSNQLIRRVNISTRVVSTIAGTLSTVGRADGIPGTLNSPQSSPICGWGTFALIVSLTAVKNGVSSLIPMSCLSCPQHQPDRQFEQSCQIPGLSTAVCDTDTERDSVCDAVAISYCDFDLKQHLDT